MHTRTQIVGRILACCLLAAASTLAFAQAAAPAGKQRAGIAREGQAKWGQWPC
jgi:hypothetical protein